jgi:hypothetical protein
VIRKGTNAVRAGRKDRSSGSGGKNQQAEAFRLEAAEAVEDGTALIGHIDADVTRRLAGSGAQRGNRPSAEAIGRDWHRISARIADLYVSGVPDNDTRTQAAIHEHYRWICHFWTPDRQSYLRLANLYVSQPKFRRRIERRKPEGMAAYLRDAMTAYAWAQLR